MCKRSTLFKRACVRAYVRSCVSFVRVVDHGRRRQSANKGGGGRRRLDVNGNRKRRGLEFKGYLMPGVTEPASAWVVGIIGRGSHGRSMAGWQVDSEPQLACRTGQTAPKVTDWHNKQASRHPTTNNGNQVALARVAPRLSLLLMHGRCAVWKRREQDHIGPTLIRYFPN